MRRVKKTLSVIAADRHNGSVRSKVTVAVPGRQDGPSRASRYEELPLNVDIKAEVMDNGLIRTQLILNYETFNASKERRHGRALGRHRQSDRDAGKWQADDRVAVGGCGDRSQGDDRTESDHLA